MAASDYVLCNKCVRKLVYNPDCNAIAYCDECYKALLTEIDRLRAAAAVWVFCPKCRYSVSSADTKEGFHDCGAKTVPMWSEEQRKNERLRDDNKRLRDALEKIAGAEVGYVEAGEFYPATDPEFIQFTHSDVVDIAAEALAPKKPTNNQG